MSAGVRPSAAICLHYQNRPSHSHITARWLSSAAAVSAAASLASPPSSSSHWSSLPLSFAMLSALAAVGLLSGATLVQQSAIRTAASLTSSDQSTAHSTHSTALLLAARTGSGKTLAALIPTLERAMAAERQAERKGDREDEERRQQSTALPYASSPPPPLPAHFPLPSHRLLSPASLFSVPSSSSSSSSSVLCRPLSVFVVPSRELVDQHYSVGKQLSHHLPVRVERLVAGRPRAKERRDLASPLAAPTSATTAHTTTHTTAHTSTLTTASRQYGVSVLVSTPGRLLSYIDRGLVSLSQLRTVVLDEADVLLSAASEGGFRDDCLRIIRLANTAAAANSVSSLPSLPTLPFSSSSSASVSSPLLFILSAASVPRSLRTSLPSLFSRVLDLSSPQLHTLPPSIRLSFVSVHGASDKLDRLVSVVRDIVVSHSQPRVLLFCNSLGSCRAVTAALTLHFQRQPLPPHIASRYSHSPVLSHHGDLPSQLRSSHLRSFKSGECGVLVVSDLLSRGIDLPQLTHVVQFDMSLNSTDFMHRVGRLARQPLTASPQPQYAISLVRKGDEVLANAIAAQFRASNSIAELSSDKRHYNQHT